MKLNLNLMFKLNLMLMFKCITIYVGTRVKLDITLLYGNLNYIIVWLINLKIPIIRSLQNGDINCGKRSDSTSIRFLYVCIKNHCFHNNARWFGNTFLMSTMPV